MANIEIYRKHTLGHEQARQAAEQIAAQLDERFQLDYRWQGESLHFKRSGLDGNLDVGADDVFIRVKLGLLMSPLKHMLEQEIHRQMDEVFSQA